VTSDEPIGISDLRLYVPSPFMDLKVLVEQRVRLKPELSRHLERACRTTGQTGMRYPEPWEDSATMAARAAYDLLGQGLDLQRLRHLVVGTETAVDHSKPVSAYVQGMLQRAGLRLPNALSSFQTQHACAGGTMGLLSVAGMLASGGRPADAGLVISSDVARYATESTAEVTQGAGAVAMLVERNPQLLSIDLSSVGYYSSDVDDFFRPLGSETARANGTYSMRCYWDSLQAAFVDYCARRGVKPDEELAGIDLFALHTPFRSMPETALLKLFAKVLGYDEERSRQVLAESGFAAGVDPIARIGNIYTGSLYAVLAFLLADRLRHLGDAIVGKKVLLASYGSGNTMVVFAGRVTPQAPQVMGRWNLGRVLDGARATSFEEYLAWTAGPVQPELHARIMERATLPAGSFVLAGIRKDGYREYEFKAEAEAGDRGAERSAPGDLHGPFAVYG